MRNNVEIRGAKKSYGSGEDKRIVLNNLDLTIPVGTM
jgi:hypothetical protein